MVETEKVCNHKVSSVSSSELIQSKRANIGTGTANGSPSRRPTITRSTSAYYVFASLPQVVHSVRPKTGYRNNVSSFSVLWRAMLEEEGTEHSRERDSDPGGTAISNGLESTSVLSLDDGGRADNATTTTTTSTTTLRIHSTYKKRAAKFMNRPNVQNGLGASSFLNPYGGGAGSPPIRLANSLQSPSLSFQKKHNHRPVITRSSLFGGGGGGGAAPSQNISNSHNSFNSTPSPQGTTASTTTASTTVESRPPFVTTVTRGKFLPSKFDLMVEKSLFTFSSRPKPVGLITKHHCSLSGGPLKENNSQNPLPRGAHDYFNVMWDPHIYRGTTTTFTSSLKQPDSENRRDDERYRKRRGFASNPNGPTNNLYNNNVNSNSISPTGMGNRQRYRMTTKVSSRSRTFPPPQFLSEGRHQVQVQTEEYLEDFTRDVSRPEVDAVVQTDPVQDELLLESRDGVKRRLILSEKSGVDASTQVLPGELVTFDEQVQPIVEALVGKILEQALVETMEEEEIWALKAQQNRFLEKRKEEERELCSLREQQERISAEKERLKSHLQAQLLRQQNGDAEALLKMINRNSGGEAEDANENPEMMLSTAYLLELLPSVINSLRQEGLLADQPELTEHDVLSSLTPIWSSTSKPESEPNAGDDGDAEDNEPFPDGYQSRTGSPEIGVTTQDREDISQSLAEALEKEVVMGGESVEDDVEMDNVEAIDQDENLSDLNEDVVDNDSEPDLKEVSEIVDGAATPSIGEGEQDAEATTNEAEDCEKEEVEATGDADAENSEDNVSTSPNPEEETNDPVAEEAEQQPVSSESPTSLSKLPNGAISNVDSRQSVAED